MKKLIFILSITIFVSCSSNSKENKETPIEEKFERTVENVIERYPSGKKKIEGKLVNGERHGKWVYYYDNGFIWSEGKYWHGKRKGYSIVYYKNGFRKLAGEYKDDLKVGVWKVWKEDGTLVKSIDLNTMLSKSDSLKLDLQ